jgi:spermidine synthase
LTELDPVVEAVGRKFFRTGETANLRTLRQDGRQALRQAGARYDGIFIDAYQGVMAIPFHLTTKEFFEEVRGALKPGGVVGMNIIGRFDEDKGLFCAMAQTLSGVFPNVRLHPIHGPKGGLQNVIVAASPETGADLSGVLKGTAFSQGFDAASLACLPGQVLTDDHAPAEWLAAGYLR